jgi:Ubiquitin carboxyl-terminal hydrolase
MRSPTFIPSSASPLAAVMNHSLFQPAHPDEEKLISFADMLFGGKLTSILVCQKCKHISQTYEDFNDLSLSIKAEDYARERTRDRLKNLAKKFKNLHGTSLSLGLELQRSSSVPASPSANVDGPFTDEPPIVEPRRRSLDYVEVAKEGGGGGGGGGDGDTIGLTETFTTVPADDESGRVAGGLDRKVERVEFTEPLKLERKDKKVKDDDGWARLGRRISMKVTKKTKDKDDRHSRSMDLGRSRRSADLETVKEKDGYQSLSVSSPHSTTTMSSPQQPGSDGDPSPVSPPDMNRPKLENTRSVSLSPALPTSTTPTISPPQSSFNRFPLISRASSPSKPGRRAKSPQPAKTTAEEAAYLRQVLADITPASSNPFGIFKPPVLQSGGGNMSSTATNLLLKMGQLPGIEECLRMFTAVEVLDGENMVGCRQCWKVANGEYKPKMRPQDSDSDESEKSDGTAAKPDGNLDQPGRVAFDLERVSPPPLSSSSPSASASSSIASLDAQSGSIYNTPSSSPSDDALPLSQSHSTPPPLPSALNGTAYTLGVSEPRMTTYGGMPIPVISTTAPESPFSPLTTAKATSCFPSQPSFTDHSGLAEALAAPLPVKDSLRAPKFTRHRRMPGDADSTTESADESSDDALDSDASGSMLSDSSSVGSRAASPVVTPSVSVERLSVATKSMPRPPSAPPKVPRSKQIIMRPAFKRYLIATPPPVLVIHLKRFKQVSKTPMISFSSGFKKLEDFVAFPETLDIGPFIAPRKEDFGLGKGSRLKTSKRTGRCMYRLYAVVVHIGNMVCFNLTFGLIVCPNEKL